METTTSAKNGVTNANTAKKVEETVNSAEVMLRERVENARDLIEDLRDRAEMAFHERPYLLPVATGAVGLGIGVLIGSKLSRILLLTAAGAMLSDSVRSQVAKFSQELIKDLGDKLEGSEDDIEEGEPSTI